MTRQRNQPRITSAGLRMDNVQLDAEDGSYVLHLAGKTGLTPHQVVARCVSTVRSIMAAKRELAEEEKEE